MLSPRTARTNRLSLAIVGVLLLALGLFGLGETQSLWFAHSAHQPLLINQEIGWVHHHDWIWWLAALVAAAIALACLRWLLIQARSSTVRTLDLEPDPTCGYTRIAGSAVARAVESELDSYPDVTRAHAELVRTVKTELRLSIRTNGGANLASLRTRIENELLPHVRQALETDELAFYLNLIVT